MGLRPIAETKACDGRASARAYGKKRAERPSWLEADGQPTVRLGLIRRGMFSTLWQILKDAGALETPSRNGPANDRRSRFVELAAQGWYLFHIRAPRRSRPVGGKSLIRGNDRAER
nr:hypothetical protein GCM10010200_021740 [Actinomadura rugatobispora]